MSMLVSLLEWCVAYLTYVHPLLIGVKLCCEPHPDPVQVTNITLSIMLGWMLEMIDVVFFSYFIALRALYLILRIFVALYFAHRTFLGALRVYETCCAWFVEMYLPIIDTMVMHHLDVFSQLGPTQACVEFATLCARKLICLLQTVQQLVSGIASTDVAPASLPRHSSQHIPHVSNINENKCTETVLPFVTDETDIAKRSIIKNFKQPIMQQPPSLYFNDCTPEEIDRTLSPSEGEFYLQKY